MTCSILNTRLKISIWFFLQVFDIAFLSEWIVLLVTAWIDTTFFAYFDRRISTSIIMTTYWFTAFQRQNSKFVFDIFFFTIQHLNTRLKVIMFVLLSLSWLLKLLSPNEINLPLVKKNTYINILIQKTNKNNHTTKYIQ